MHLSARRAALLLALATLAAPLTLHTTSAAARTGSATARTTATQKRAKAPRRANRRTTRRKRRRRRRPAPPSRTQISIHNNRTLASLRATAKRSGRAVPWKRIVIHHTAGGAGTVAGIGAFHREKFNDPDGIEYHFLIGNGRGHGDGQIMLGRWKLQKRAIHLFHPERAPDAIAVSLVGNFETRKLGAHQRRALVRLLARLTHDYNIPIKNITTHRGVDGRLTQCPGKHFPLKRVIAETRDARAKLAAPKPVTPKPAAPTATP